MSSYYHEKVEFFLRISNAILKEEKRFKLDFDMFYFAKQMSKESVYSKLYGTFAITNNLAMAIFSLLHFKNGQNSTQVYEYIYQL